MDEPRLFGERDEARGRHRSALGMVPAQESLAARERARARVELGLVVERELAALERRPQVGLQALALAVFFGHGRGEQTGLPAPQRLRPIERDVGVPQQVAGRAAVLGRQGDADAAAGTHRLLLDRERFRERTQEPPGEREGLLRLREVGNEDRELVAAQSREDVARAQLGAQPRRGDAQELVAGGVTERVVDVLETVEIEQEHGEPTIGSRVQGEPLFERLPEPSSVGEAGEGIVRGEISCALERPALGGDVRGGPAPARVTSLAIADRARGQAEQARLRLGSGRSAQEIAERGGMREPGFQGSFGSASFADGNEKIGKTRTQKTRGLAPQDLFRSLREKNEPTFRVCLEDPVRGDGGEIEEALLARGELGRRPAHLRKCQQDENGGHDRRRSEHRKAGPGEPIPGRRRDPREPAEIRSVDRDERQEGLASADLDLGGKVAEIAQFQPRACLLQKIGTQALSEKEQIRGRPVLREQVPGLRHDDRSGEHHRAARVREQTRHRLGALADAAAGVLEKGVQTTGEHLFGRDSSRRPSTKSACVVPEKSATPLYSKPRLA